MRERRPAVVLSLFGMALSDKLTTNILATGLLLLM
jgi:hypothetical protein